MTDIYVSSAEELYSALAAASAGQHILLEAGEYDDIALWYGLGIELDLNGVTLASANPDTPAVIHNFEAKGVSNLTIENVVFDYDAVAGQTPFKRPFEFSDCVNITLDGITFDGDLAQDVSVEADGYATGIGLSVRGCTDFTLTDSVFETFMIGASFGNSVDVTILNNDLSGMRVDGLTFTKMQEVLIAGNTIHDFARNLSAGDHSDMIQFWTNGNTEAMSNISIIGNTLDMGSGDHTQGIFFGNEALDQGYGTEMFYQSLMIAGNSLINGHLNGIYVGGANDLSILGNTLVNPDPLAETTDLPRIRVDQASTDVTISGNFVSDIWGYKDQSDWLLAGNLTAPLTVGETAEFVSSDATVCRRFAPGELGDSFDFTQARPAPSTDTSAYGASGDGMCATGESGSLEKPPTELTDIIGTELNLFGPAPEYM
ncbi:right-handed parallel beta-helix repeat-containing protein [Donghicola mangrovi]|uniref:Right-handed parallel beta-helix repeat-containing protein n=1 Tax=Donghicola mangrovi TaxID=2729614 RepID=A0A850QE54_9RHOB|nr:right-handed parallel beta-helix repeat-containing protein [Donghicola mangrovi]NVO25228.1 right-handed parallel beta-helix repeat-containing protein [Donghicola mangrovi]